MVRQSDALANKSRDWRAVQRVPGSESEATSCTTTSGPVTFARRPPHFRALFHSRRTGKRRRLRARLCKVRQRLPADALARQAVANLTGIQPQACQSPRPRPQRRANLSRRRLEAPIRPFLRGLQRPRPRGCYSPRLRDRPQPAIRKYLIDPLLRMLSRPAARAPNEIGRLQRLRGFAWTPRGAAPSRPRSLLDENSATSTGRLPSVLRWKRWMPDSGTTGHDWHPTNRRVVARRGGSSSASNMGRENPRVATAGMQLAPPRRRKLLRI